MTTAKHNAEKFVAGNVYDKYGARNPIVRLLMRRFDRDMATLLNDTGSISSILEVGCGEGEVTRKLADQFPKSMVIGYDISPEIIAEARRRHPGLIFEVKSIYDQADGLEPFDLLVACEVLEHLDDPHKALRALATKSKGYFFASVPREPLWRIMNCARGKYLADWGNTPGHIQHWGKSDFINFLRTQMDIVAVRTPIPWIQVLCRTRQ